VHNKISHEFRRKSTITSASQRQIREIRRVNSKFSNVDLDFDNIQIIVEIRRPFGIVLESIEKSRGASIAEVLVGGNAAKVGKIEKGDVLLSIEVNGCIFDCGPTILFDKIVEHLAESPAEDFVKLNVRRVQQVNNSDIISAYWEKKKQRKVKGLSVLRRTVGVKPSDIRIYRNGLIGEGNFGKVFSGEWNGQKVVLKTSKSTVMRADELLDSELEINEYVHKNAKDSCARFYGCCEIDELNSGNLYDESLPTGLWLLWENEAEFTLHDAIKLSETESLEILRRSCSSYNRSSSLDVYQRIIADLLICLSKIHSVGVVHRDVKPENIILTENGVKFIDLGGAALCLGKQPISYEPGIGPVDPRYSKPDDRYVLPSSAKIPVSTNMVDLWFAYMPEKFDIFAIGLVILQVLLPCLRNPQALENFKVELEKCGYDFKAWRDNMCCFPEQEVKFLDIENGAGSELVACMLTPDRSTRKDANTILQHRFFKIEKEI